jgi:hypothetical protein
VLRWIIAAFLAAIGAYVVWRNMRNTGRAKAAQSWTKVPGKVTDSRIDEELYYDYENRPETVFKPVLAYEYAAGGETRTGSQIDFDQNTGFTRRNLAEKRLAPYPVGKTVEVLVDPADPARTCLAAKSKPDFLVPGIFFVLALITALGLFGG